MSIFKIDLRHKRGTYGLQVRVRRGELKPLNKFFSFSKYGGEENARRLAEQAEAEMKAQVALLLPDARFKNEHARKPNANSSTGIAGIRAFYDDDGNVHFSACWRVGPPKRRRNRVIQRNSKTHGLLGALKQVLDARAAGTGIEQPSPKAAWAIIKRHLDEASTKAPKRKPPTSR